MRSALGKSSGQAWNQRNNRGRRGFAVEVPDDGERETIQLALELRADFILIDEHRERQAADRGLRTIGTLGVLLEAKRQGLIADSLQLPEELSAQGFRVSKRLVAEFRRLSANP